MDNSVLVNGIALESLQLRPSNDLSAWWDGATVERETTTIPGAPGAVATGPEEWAERVLAYSGFQRADSMQELNDLRDGLLLLLYGRDLDVALARRPDRVFRARLSGKVEVKPIRPVLSSLTHLVDFRLLCLDPFAYSAAETVVDFAAPAGAVLPLGTAPVRPVLTLGGVTDPVLVYRDAAGVERARMELHGSISAGNPVTVDCGRMRITDSTGAVPVAWPSGSFLRFDPTHALGLALPSLTVSPTPALAEARYRMAWLSL